VTYVLGLTGSIGMGKSTTAQLLRQEGIPVWDADDAVHRLYAAGGAAVPPIAQLCPSVIVNGGIDRSALRSAIESDPSLLTKIQDIVHPLVAADRAAFIAATAAPILVLDIPLLFEIGADAQCDGVLVVTTSPKEQKSRVLQRGLTEAQFDMILSRQMPDIEKRARATWVVETHSLAHVQAQLHLILDQIRKTNPDA
jgi:dephospho-CoA kinase